MSFSGIVAAGDAVTVADAAGGVTGFLVEDAESEDAVGAVDFVSAVDPPSD